jgi:hypothetical protein
MIWNAQAFFTEAALAPPRPDEQAGNTSGSGAPEASDAPGASDAPSASPAS